MPTFDWEPRNSENPWPLVSFTPFLTGAAKAGSIEKGADSMAKGAGSILKMMMVTALDMMTAVRTWQAQSSPAVEGRTYLASAGGPEKRCPGGGQVLKCGACF